MWVDGWGVNDMCFHMGKHREVNMATGGAGGMNESKQIWLVDKYARLVASREPSALSLSQDQGEGNSWQVEYEYF